MPTTPDRPLIGGAERAVLGVVRREGSIARASIAAQTQFTQPWVHRLTASLLSAGWLISGAPEKKGRGQPSPTLSIAGDAAYAVGLNVDTDVASACLCDLTCRVVDRWRLRTAPHDRAKTLRAMRTAVDSMLARHGVPHERVVGVGCAISGYFVATPGHVNAPEPLRDWSLVDLNAAIGKVFDWPVWIINNATAAGLGESMTGVGRWAQTFCYLSFVYGFGSGVIIDGKPYVGRHGNAGEMMILRPGVEAEDRPALRYLLAELQSHGVDVKSIDDLRLRYDPEWPGLQNWMDRVQPHLDRIVNTLTGLFDPDAIVFGGLLPPALGDALIERTRFWGNYRYGVEPPLPRLVRSEAGVEASVIGAALQPLMHHFYA